ncbi:MAG: NPCBM/NEW2 domain-containing protein [Planctomycetota bacterium]
MRLLESVTLYVALFGFHQQAAYCDAIVEAAMIDGTTVRGTLTSLSKERLVLAKASGAQVAVAAGALPTLQFVSSNSPDEDQQAGAIYLRDGSVLPIESVESSPKGSKLRIGLSDADRATPAEVDIGIDRIRCIRLPESPEGFVEPWQAMRKRSSTSDLIVTRPKTADSLDYVEGYVESIGRSAVRLYLDEQPLDVSREKIFGIVFASESSGVRVDPHPLVATRGGMQLFAKRLRLLAADLSVTTAAGVDVTVPLSNVSEIDFSYGRLTYLSDLAPLATENDPLFGPLRDRELSAAWPVFRTNAALWGGPLVARDPLTDDLRRRDFDRGLSITAGGTVAYDVEGYTEFRCVADIAPDSSPSGSVRLVIEIDRKQELRREFNAAALPLDLVLPLMNARELRLRVERQSGIRGSVHLGQARLIR